VKPRAFDYVRPDSAEEALALLAEYGDDARVLAGGQSLMAMLNLRLAEPDVLIDISRLSELDEIGEADGKIEIGASVTQNKLLAWPGLSEKLPLVAKMLPHVGHFQTRNRGTVCGSIAHADPSSELPLALAVLAGEVVLRSKRGMRHGDFALIAIAVVAEGKGVRIGVGGLSGKPITMQINSTGSSSVGDAVAALALRVGGLEDIHASAPMRRDMLRNLAPVVVEDALRCAA
jgi:2-furoyl-CoA dehydrogenase FAD binding subunit